MLLSEHLLLLLRTHFLLLCSDFQNLLGVVWLRNGLNLVSRVEQSTCSYNWYLKKNAIQIFGISINESEAESIKSPKSRVSVPVWYWPDPDPTSQDKTDPDPASQDKPDSDPWFYKDRIQTLDWRCDVTGTKDMRQLVKRSVIVMSKHLKVHNFQFTAAILSLMCVCLSVCYASVCLCLCLQCY